MSKHLMQPIEKVDNVFRFKKNAHGGVRKNAGRKPQGEAAKVTLTVTVSREVKEHLAATGNASQEVERLVRKSKEFVKCTNTAPQS